MQLFKSFVLQKTVLKNIRTLFVVSASFSKLDSLQIESFYACTAITHNYLLQLSYLMCQNAVRNISPTSILSVLFCILYLKKSGRNIYSSWRLKKSIATERGAFILSNMLFFGMGSMSLIFRFRDVVNCKHQFCILDPPLYIDMDLHSLLEALHRFEHKIQMRRLTSILNFLVQYVFLQFEVTLWILMHNAL